MATITGNDPSPSGRSGAKIVKKRWSRSATTPYDRPPPPPRPEHPHGSPNWLTGVIFPTTRMIASGAVKMISSVFDSSSSSSSDSEGEGEGDPDISVPNEDNYDLTDGVDNPNKECMISSEGRNVEPQLSLFNSVTKSAIARLLMQERFSRLERDTLVQIIDARVLDLIDGEVADVMRIDVPVANTEYVDLCTEAVTEARKWLEGKKVGSSPQSDLAYQSHTLNFVSQHTENDSSSPVDYAKSYMKSRPPWASPLVQSTKLQTPIPLTRELFGEGSSASFLGGSLSVAKKRNSLASGSWNIEDELRRLRSKASEDMLSSPPSTNINILSVQTTPKFAKHSVGDLPVCVEGKGNKFDVVIDNQLVDAQRATLGVDMSIDSTVIDALRSSETFQGVAVNLTGEDAGLKLKSSVQLDGGTECDDPWSSQRIVHLTEGVTESPVMPTANGVHTSQARSFTAKGDGDIPQKPDEGNSSSVNINTKATNSIQVEDVCELLSEASVEVPIVDGTNGIVDVSQSVSSVLHEDLTMTLSQPNNDKMVVADDGMTVKQEPKKSSRYSRRGRARVKL